MVNNFEGKTQRTRVIIVKPQNDMHYVLYNLQPDWSLLSLVNMQGSL